MEKEVKTDDFMDLGQQAESNVDIDKAIHYYELAAKDGITDGLASIGLLYQYGTGVEQSYPKAIEWYQRILDAGDVDGWYLLGIVYEQMEDYDKSAECYERR